MKLPLACLKIIATGFLFTALPKVHAYAQELIDIPEVSQRAKISQRIGLTDITVTYHRPKVNDREIWGAVVPYNTSASSMPWRAGANQTTLIEFSSHVTVEGQELAPGKYGLHMLVHEDGDITVIFSNNFTSWGSFAYKQEEDALRVKVASVEIPHHEVLSYDFTMIGPNQATVMLKWEKRGIPITIGVDSKTVTLGVINSKLEGPDGRLWQNYRSAAYFAADVGEKELAEKWALTAITGSGHDAYCIIDVADIFYSIGNNADADRLMMELMDGPAATATIIYRYGRKLIDMDRARDALKVYETRLSKKFPSDQYLINLGYGRAYSSLGEYKKALGYVRKAQVAYLKLENQSAVQVNAFSKYIEALEAGKDFN